MTLVEVLGAVTILTVVVWGAVAFMMHGRVRVEVANQERVAAQIAIERLERARAGGYSSISYDYGAVTVNSTPYSWSLYSRTKLADPDDAQSTFKEIEISVSWPNDGGRSVTMTTAIAP